MRENKIEIFLGICVCGLLISGLLLNLFIFDIITISIRVALLPILISFCGSAIIILTTEVIDIFLCISDFIKEKRSR